MTALQRQTTKAAIAGLMLAFWFGLNALAVSPQLHHWLHKDSTEPQHQCFIAQLNKGFLLQAFENGISAVPLDGTVAAFFPEQVHFYPAVEDGICLSRAPPSSSSSIAVVG